MYSSASAPTAAEAASWGLTLEEATPTVEVWPDNLAAVNVFIRMSTQWRSSGFGATGLDYAALTPVLRLSRIPRVDWPALFEDLRVLEEEALRVMRIKHG